MTKRTSKKVFVAQEVLKRSVDNERVPVFDFSPAIKYGKLEIIVPYNTPIHPVDELVSIAKYRMEDFRAHDYLLAVGDPVVIAVCSVIALQRTGGFLSLLKWNKLAKDYEPVHIDFFPYRPRVN